MKKTVFVYLTNAVFFHEVCIAEREVMLHLSHVQTSRNDAYCKY